MAEDIQNGSNCASGNNIGLFGSFLYNVGRVIKQRRSKKALQSDVIDTVLPLFNVYNIVMAVLLAAVVVLCVVTYRKMAELTAESYRWLKLFIIFTSCINAVSTAAGELFRYFIFINTEYKVDVSNILFAAFAVVLMVFWMILNLRYFKKRKDLFAD